ncbi:MAG: DUF2442 domain-containing protein [Rhodanobacteraceae bacterium]|nr:MAG: DUF2442 domain-containing protein [Rhodanobacteraceae bacterium]
MAITDREFTHAEQQMQRLRQHGHAVAARYDRRRARVVVSLNTGVEVTFPPKLAEGLADAAPADLALVEITPSGLGLHWPKLDVDLFVPGLLAGAFGSKRWMAAQLGAAGGSARSKAKTRASRTNGHLGGRPLKRSSEK